VQAASAGDIVFRLAASPEQEPMDDKRAMLLHFLAALAYRSQKALRGAPPSFGEFEAGNQVRNPKWLVQHMDGVLGYALTCFAGEPESYRGAPLPTLDDEILRFHGKLESLASHLRAGTALRRVTPEQMLQGPFSDAMTHAGQLAMLRRLAGSPIPPENFIVAEISPDNLGPSQPSPKSPDVVWPERPQDQGNTEPR
jgi:hypothetical protein